MSKQLKSIEKIQLYDKITKLENKILSKIQTIKNNKKQIDCIHFQRKQQNSIQYDPQKNYYEIFWKNYLKNQIGLEKIEQMQKINMEFQQEISQVEKLLKSRKHYNLTNKKKNRRLAEQIQKCYYCPYSNCEKCYSSETPLNFHIKQKHNGGSKKDRDNATKQILQALKKNQLLPTFQINLPDGLIQSLRQKVQRGEEQDVTMTINGINKITHQDNQDLSRSQSSDQSLKEITVNFQDNSFDQQNFKML